MAGTPVFNNFKDEKVEQLISIVTLFTGPCRSINNKNEFIVDFYRMEDRNNEKTLAEQDGHIEGLDWWKELSSRVGG